MPKIGGNTFTLLFKKQNKTYFLSALGVMRACNSSILAVGVKQLTSGDFSAF